MLRIDYRESDWRAVLRWDEADESAPWLAIVRRLVHDSSDESAQEGAWQISLPWWSLASARDKFLAVFKGFALVPGARLEIGPLAALFDRRESAWHALLARWSSRAG